MKGPPHNPSIMNAGLRCAHTQAHAPPSSITPLAGLSDVSVISCPARLNYDVNNSLLVSTSTPTSCVHEHTRTRSQTHPSESDSCISCVNLTSHMLQTHKCTQTLSRTLQLQLSCSLIPTITHLIFTFLIIERKFHRILSDSCRRVPQE